MLSGDYILTNDIFSTLETAVKQEENKEAGNCYGGYQK